MDIVYECVVCHKQTVSERAATIEKDSCCRVCAEDHNRLGKFQAYKSSDPEHFDAETMGKCLILHAWVTGSGEDEWMSNDGWGYCGRFGNYLLYEDTSGFVTYEEFSTEEEAEKSYNKLYMDGMGADETDIYISVERNGWHAFDGDAGKEIPAWPRCHEPTFEDHNIIDRSRILAAVRLYCSNTGYYPNVWESNERGTLTHVGEEIW